MLREQLDMSDSFKDNWQGKAKSEGKNGIDENEEDVEEVEPTPDQTGLRFLWTAQKNLIDEMRCIHEKEPDVIHFKDTDGYTALHRACYSNQPEAVLFLLMKNADVSARTIDGWMPIHSASRWNAGECLDLLIAWGADVNAVTHGGQTPLHLAAFLPDSRRTIQRLLMHSRIRQPEINGQSDAPKDIAMRNNNCVPLFDLLKPHFREVAVASNKKKDVS